RTPQSMVTAGALTNSPSAMIAILLPGSPVPAQPAASVRSPNLALPSSVNSMLTTQPTPFSGISAEALSTSASVRAAGPISRTAPSAATTIAFPASLGSASTLSAAATTGWIPSATVGAVGEVEVGSFEAG